MTGRQKRYGILGGILILIAVVLVWRFVHESSLPPDFAEFAEQYRTYHEAGDVDGLAGLVYWGETGERARRIFRYAMEEETRWPLKDIQARPVRKGDIEEVWGDSSPRPAIKPEWRVWFLLETEDGFTSTWLAGRTPDGIRLIAGPVADGEASEGSP